MDKIYNGFFRQAGGVTDINGDTVTYIHNKKVSKAGFEGNKNFGQ